MGSVNNGINIKNKMNKNKAIFFEEWRFVFISIGDIGKGNDNSY